MTQATASRSQAVSREPVADWTLTLLRPSPNTPAAAAEALQDGIRTRVPGSVLGTLIAEDLANDVTLDGLEDSIAWAAASTWMYSACVPRQGDGSQVRLVLEGVDTLATVLVDGSPALTTDDMFHAWVIDLGIDDEPGEWLVEIVLESVLPVIADAEAAHPLPRSDMYELPFNQIRKMACSFGWDWGPTTVTSGLWRAAHVERTPRARLANVLVNTSWPNVARLHAAFTVDGPAECVAVEVREPAGGRVLAAATTRVADGAGSVDLEVPGAEQWNVTGRGAQPLYEVHVIAELADGSHCDSAMRRVGFRTIEVVERPDAAGTSFEVHVNGARVWARGFNWIPSDVLPERVTADHARRLVSEAVEAGANMLRVWGGGVVESDDFFDACDEMGVLVWQDFAFACAAYAEDDEQAARVTREVEDAVSRVGHRASLALWCGCNENLWAWEDWGWKERMGADAAWGRRLYYEVIPAVLSVLDPLRPYIPGSPFSPDVEAHPNDGTQGTTHHWDTWNELDYIHFESKASRFASEFGWQAPAAWPTLVRALGGAPATGSDASLVRLQKHPQGMAALARSVADHVPHLPVDGAGWHFATQLVQARAIRASIGHFRSMHESCSGALWWQLNDCWPALSWSVLDVTAKRKLGWYAARQTMSARAIVETAPGSAHALTLVNDTPAAWPVAGTLTVATPDGTVVHTQPVEAVVEADGHLEVTPSAVPAGAAVVVVDVDGIRGCRWLISDLDLPTTPAVLESVEATGDDETARITVTAGSLVRDLCLLAEHDLELAEVVVDRQLVTLLPGETVTFTATGPGAGQASSLRWVSLLASTTAVTLR